MKKKEILILVIAIVTIVLVTGVSMFAGGFIMHAFGNYVSNLFNLGYELNEFKCFIASVLMHIVFIAWAIIGNFIEDKKMKG